MTSHCQIYIYIYSHTHLILHNDLTEDCRKGMKLLDDLVFHNLRTYIYAYNLYSVCVWSYIWYPKMISTII